MLRYYVPGMPTGTKSALASIRFKKINALRFDPQSLSKGRPITFYFLYDHEEKRMAVHASVRMLIPSQKQDEVLGILGSPSQKARYEEGCISCRVYRGEEEENGILLEELWSDEEFLKHHLRSSEFYKVLLVSE
jgi:quinol monooxygenase YgiN